MDHTTISKIWHKALANQEALTSEEISFLIEILSNEEGISIIEKEVYNNSDGVRRTSLRKDYTDLYDKINKQIGRKRAPVKFLHILTRVAAAIALPLLAFSIYLLTQIRDETHQQVEIPSTWEQEYIIPIGVKSKIILGDSTVIWLNSGSRLMVDNDFGNGRRLVSLDGEGYFKVKSDKNNPFIVKAKDLDVEVVGTEFNISAYSDSERIEAVLVSGEIRASSSKFAELRETITMLPSQKLTVHEISKKIVLENNIITDKYRSWKDNLMVFTDTPIKEVATILERWYNVKVKITSSQLENLLLTGKFENRSLDQVLKFLKMTLPLDYVYKDDIVTLSYK